MLREPSRRDARGRSLVPALLFRTLSLCLTALLLGCSGEGEGSGPEETPAPRAENLILITVDTLRADHLGFHGYPRDASPFLDRWAASNTVFLDAAVTAPKTWPSLASIFTSRYPERIGVLKNGHVLAEESQTLAEILGERGFTTVAFAANRVLTRERGVAQGFDEFTNVENPGLAETLVNQTVKRLRTGLEPPFFLWLHFLDPHGPYSPPPPYGDTFIGDEHYDPEPKVRLRYEPALANRNLVLGAVPRYQQGVHRQSPRRRERDFYIAQYDGEIRYLDSQLERLFAAFEEHGVLENTAVAFTADHGEALGEHDYYFEHGWFVYQHQLHVPLVLHLPGETRGRRIRRPVSLLDLTPTLLEALAIPSPADFQGTSLLPMLRGASQEPREIYAVNPPTYPEAFRSLRTGPWKYIAGASGSEELYHLVEDPGELHDRSSEHPDILEILRARLAAGPWNADPSAEAQAMNEVDEETLDEETRSALRSLGYL